MRVLKYTLPQRGEIELSLPEDSTPLSVASQHGEVVMWVQVSSVSRHKIRKFAVLYTGHDDVPFYNTYIGTVVAPDGIVSHVYEVDAS